MNKPILKYLFYLPLQYIRGEYILDEIKNLSAMKKLSFDDLKEFQWYQLKSLLNNIYIYDKYYKNIWDKAGVNINMINSIEDFKLIPTITKENLIEYNQYKIKNNTNIKYETKLTSGSTGLPLKIIKDRSTQAKARAVMYRNYAWHGIDIGDRQARFTGYSIEKKLHYVEKLKDIFTNRIRINVFNLSKVNVIKEFLKLIKFKPKYIYGYPSAIYKFFDILVNNSIDTSELNLNAIITTGENIRVEQSNFLMHLLNCPVVNEYGSTETGPIAFECKYQKMHLMSDNLYIESINNKESTQYGAIGDIVITELFNYTNPLIRYKLGDRIKLCTKDEFKCPCGTNLPIIEKILGRSSNTFVLKDKREVHSEIFDFISDCIYQKLGYCMKQYKIIQLKENEFHYLIVPTERYSESTKVLLEQTVKQYLCRDVKITIELVNQICNAKSGKFSNFESKI